MNILVAMDSFKDCMSSIEAGKSVKEGILSALPGAVVNVIPVADGGEGTIEALTNDNGSIISIPVISASGKTTEAIYGICNDNVAVIEMAKCAGIGFTDRTEKSLFCATTYGVGQLVKDAIKRGCHEFIIGIGGSGTNDCGTGMLTALGYRFLNSRGKEIKVGVEGLADIHTIDSSKRLMELDNCIFHVACDVNNPLCGSDGCSIIYGPQKGATPEGAIKMDKWICHFAEICKQTGYEDFTNFPGAGAAGGMGFAFKTFLQTELQSGISLVIRQTGLLSYIKAADIVITGEGRMDGQSIKGKTPVGIAAAAKQYGKKVVAFTGVMGENAKLCLEHGIDEMYQINAPGFDPQKAMIKETAETNIRIMVEKVFKNMY